MRLPAEGLEPTRPCGHWILSPARLPIPPRRLLERTGQYCLRAEAQVKRRKLDSRRRLACRSPSVVTHRGGGVGRVLGVTFGRGVGVGVSVGVALVVAVAVAVAVGVVLGVVVGVAVGVGVGS
jgi:hypothetical protein